MKQFWDTLLLLITKQRASSYPYLSGDTWRFFCDWRLSDEEGFDPKKVEEGDTIFAEFGLMDRFASQYLPKIRSHFILVTPNAEQGTDHPMPGPFAHLLDHPFLAAWCLQNLDRSPTGKIIPIPIGLANRFWAHGDIEAMDRSISVKRKKELLVYVNFSVGLNRTLREPCLRYFEQTPFARIESSKSYPEYLDALARSVFVASPPGNGLDCHRTWEALLMGCYPIVWSSTLNPLYKELPVVIVKDWWEATLPFLQQKQREFDRMSWSREKLYAPYWFEKVRAIQTHLRTRPQTISSP